jgi:hypothetical protein
LGIKVLKPHLKIETELIDLPLLAPKEMMTLKTKTRSAKLDKNETKLFILCF